MIKKQTVVLDTSKLMENISEVEALMEDYQLIIPEVVLEELDNHKDNYRDAIRSYKGRNAIKFIYKNYDRLVFKDCSNEIIGNDNKIIDTAVKGGSMVCTGDICMKVKSQSNGLNVLEVDENITYSDYHGYREIYANNDEDNIKLAELYQDMDSNPFKMHIGEYLLVKDEDENTKDKMKLTDEGFVNVRNKTIDSMYLGKIKPLDDHQTCLVDSLYDNQMTMVRGKPGSGKSLLSLAYAMSEIEKGTYNKLIILSNPVSSKNSARLGFYPGTRTEKILDSFVGSMLSSKFGGMEGIYQLIDSGKLEILPFSDIRGYDTTGMKAIVYIVEAQNLDVDLMKLAIQRVSDDCKIIIDGDNNSQVDMLAYEGSNNGMSRVSEIFKGHDFYGEVELKEIHRSKMASIADQM